jgi:hypothetical protein
METTLIFETAYSHALAFEGSADVASFIKLLSKAKTVTRRSGCRGYSWYLSDPNEDIKHQMHMLSRSIADEDASGEIRSELERLQALVERNRDLLEAAERLTSGEGVEP